MSNSTITIGLAQLPVAKGAVAENLETHLAYIDRAAKQGADVVVFPELSLTGYEPELLERLALPKTSGVFSTLGKAAARHNIVVIVGCPLVNPGHKPYIGAVIGFPSGECEFYAKQHLHDGEDAYCSAGNESYLFSVNDARIALAVCADFAHPAHSDAAAAQHVDLYIASALISEAGYKADAELLSGIAQRHQFPVLLSNHISITGGWQACGNSGGWNAQGEHVVVANGCEHGIVLCHLLQGKLTSS